MGPDGSFTVGPDRLARIAGGMLADGAHSLELRGTKRATVASGGVAILDARAVEGSDRAREGGCFRLDDRVARIDADPILVRLGRRGGYREFLAPLHEGRR